MIAAYGLNKGEKLDVVTARMDFKMVDAFVGKQTGGAVAQTSMQMTAISVWQGRIWVSQYQGMHGSGWQVVVRAKLVIVDPRDAAVTVYDPCKYRCCYYYKLSQKTPINLNQLFYIVNIMAADDLAKLRVPRFHYDEV